MAKGCLGNGLLQSGCLSTASFYSTHVPGLPNHLLTLYARPSGRFLARHAARVTLASDTRAASAPEPASAEYTRNWLSPLFSPLCAVIIIT